LPTTSTAESPLPSAEPVRRAGLFVRTGGGLDAEIDRVRATARRCGVEIVDDEPDLVVVLGGDGTILRAFHEHLGRAPVIGVNFGRFGFLASIEPGHLEEGLSRAFAGEYVVLDFPTLEYGKGQRRAVAVNDFVAASAGVGRIVEIEWAIGGEPLGRVPCDGIILATPPGSTAYNLSNNGPVLMWGIDAMAVSFIAPHSLLARPLVVPRGRDVVVTNRTPEVAVALVADGQPVGELEPGDSVTVRLGSERSLLATLPDATFLTRFRAAFG
jgi:NAD+ kinase